MQRRFVTLLNPTQGQFYSSIVPGRFNFDVAFTREFPFKERCRLDFRSDFFHVLNHANGNAPSMCITSATFGQVTTFASPRMIRLARKFHF